MTNEYGGPEADIAGHDDIELVEIDPNMRLAIDPLLWCQREWGPPATFGAAVWSDKQFLLAGNVGDGDAVFRLLERDGDEEWRLVGGYDEFADALVVLVETLDDLPKAAPAPDGTAVLAMPAADGLVGAVQVGSGYSRAFEAWGNPGELLLDGGQHSTLAGAMQRDIDDMIVKG